MGSIGILYLLPNALSEDKDTSFQFPTGLLECVASLDVLIAESEKEGRRYLRRFQVKELPILLLNEHTNPSELKLLMEPLLEGKRVGLISDAGIPCVADPGSQLVAIAKKTGVTVKAFTGPCSFILALMLSGLSGQKFSFHGYLAREQEIRKKEIKEYERISMSTKATQIIMEAPYRNKAMFEDLLQTLKNSTKLCIAVSLQSTEEFVITRTIGEWKEMGLPEIAKKPSVFLFQAISS